MDFQSKLRANLRYGMVGGEVSVHPGGRQVAACVETGAQGQLCSQWHSVLCSGGQMPRRPHDEVPGFRRGSEPSNHPIWSKRIKRMEAAFRSGPKTAREIFDLMLDQKEWPSNLTVNVIIAAQEANLIVYDGTHWNWAFDEKGNRRYIRVKPRAVPEETENLDELLPTT